MHFVGPIWGHSKWFDSDKNAQLTADTYDVFHCDGYLQLQQRCDLSAELFPVEAIRAAILGTARLLGMVFSSCGSDVGNWEGEGITRNERIRGCMSR